MPTPRELRDLYEQGVNISRLLRQHHGLQHNTEHIIEIAYDLQAGSSIDAMKDAVMDAHKRSYTREIAKAILSVCTPRSILEAGVGEATTLSGVLHNLESDVSSYGFDLSWSRVACAKRWLSSMGRDTTTLCTGNLLHMPFADNSIDVVYTSHAIEPNGGKEKPIVQELFRVARQYVILLEPCYELASDEARQRMDSHGYCRNLRGVAEGLRYKVVMHDLFPCAINPLNPTAVTVIQKQADGEPPSRILACPRFRTPLEEIGGMLFSPEASMVYPVVGGIPCLRIENGIVASRYADIVGAG